MLLNHFMTNLFHVRTSRLDYYDWFLYDTIFQVREWTLNGPTAYHILNTYPIFFSGNIEVNFSNIN